MGMRCIRIDVTNKSFQHWKYNLNSIKVKWKIIIIFSSSIDTFYFIVIILIIIINLKQYLFIISNQFFIT